MLLPVVRRPRYGSYDGCRTRVRRPWHARAAAAATPAYGGDGMGCTPAGLLFCDATAQGCICRDMAFCRAKPLLSRDIVVFLHIFIQALGKIKYKFRYGIII